MYEYILSTSYSSTMRSAVLLVTRFNNIVNADLSSSLTSAGSTLVNENALSPHTTGQESKS